MQELYEITNMTYRTQINIFKMPRNAYRETAGNVVYFATFGSTLMIGSALSLPLLGKIATLFYIAPTVSQKATHMMGFDDLNPRSAQLLAELLKTLERGHENLSKELKLNEQREITDLSDYYSCPITHEPMQDPVFFTVDCHTYERAFIEKWLKEHRRSPLSQEVMDENLSVKDVLKPNIDFRSLAEKVQEMEADGHIRTLAVKR
jgi:hypothetical protein